MGPMGPMGSMGSMGGMMPPMMGGYGWDPNAMKHWSN
jgi:hypothetical protein